MKYTMSDGRIFTDYNTSCQLNNYLQKKYNVTNMHDYRNYLQKNAEKIISDRRDCLIQEDELKGSLTNYVLCPTCKEALNYKPHSRK